MPILKEIESRHSPLLFKKDTVPEEALKNCLEAARWAPSCYNNQPWRFIIIQGDRIAELESVLPRGNHWALKAPLVGFIVAKEEDSCISQNNDNLPYFQYDCGLAMMSFVIQAQAEGLQAHQMAGYDEAEARKVLGIPKDLRVVVAFALGYEEKLENYTDEIHPKLLERIQTTKRERKPIDEVYSLNGF